jgi:5-methylcytosine-specific restriction endonuclease McrA
MRDTPLILTLDTAGQPRQWVTWQDAIVYHAKGLVRWQYGDSDYTFMGGISRMTGERSTISTQSIIAVEGTEVGKTMKRVGKELPLSSKILFRRDRHTCAYCGDVFSEHELTKDHIIPQRMKGKNTWMNLVAACKHCNHKKADRTPQGARMELLYVPYVPNKHEFLILANRKILADQLDFLRAGLPAHSRLN